MRKFLTMALPLSLAVWFTATAVGANLISDDQAENYVDSGVELQSTTNFGCIWIYWNGVWYCI